MRDFLKRLGLLTLAVAVFWVMVAATWRHTLIRSIDKWGREVHVQRGWVPGLGP